MTDNPTGNELLTEEEYQALEDGFGHLDTRHEEGYTPATVYNAQCTAWRKIVAALAPQHATDATRAPAVQDAAEDTANALAVLCAKAGMPVMAGIYQVLLDRGSLAADHVAGITETDVENDWAVVCRSGIDALCGSYERGI